MKKLFALFLCFMTAQVHATILVVKEYGVNATYASINAALAAAQNNDTIVVYDKPSGQAWIENLTIDKNLTFLHPTEGTRFKAPGQITIVPKAGMDLYFIGWDLNGNSITATSANSTATLSNRANITVTDCININNIDLRVDGIDARVFYNQTNITGTIHFRHGLAVANVLANGGIYVDQEAPTTSQNDSIIIIGNKARWCYLDTKEAGLIANNYFYIDNNAGYWGDASRSPLSIRGHNQNINSILTIANNTLTNVGGGNGTRMAMAITNCGTVNNIKIINNLCYASGTTPYGIWYENISGVSFMSHNFINTNGYSNFCNITFSNELNYTQSAAGAYGSIDTWGRASSGNTALINMGNYLGEYYDIDLSRNDIGTYGGPYSIDNYLSSGTGKGKVLYINIKHQLTNLNQILDVKASGGSKF
jgi:hypothetical protein